MRNLIAICLLLTIFYAGAVVVLTNAKSFTGRIRDMHCSVNARSLHQALTLFAQNNNDRFPLPSDLDRADHTIALAPGVDPTTKDTTANIFSILMYGTFINPSTAICVNEQSPTITRDFVIAEKDPPTAHHPDRALWDPAFNADFTGSSPSHFSYAHALPSGPRLARWKNTGDATQAVVGDRGPRLTGVSKTPASPGVRATYDGSSYAVKNHGTWSRWEGNTAFADGHVEYARSLTGAAAPPTYTDPSGTPWEDLLFHDEPDDPSGLNNLLGIFTTAGPKPEDFTRIFD